MGVGLPYVENILNSRYIAYGHSAPAAVALLFILVAGPNLLLRRFCKRLALDTAEIIVIYGMLTVASAALFLMPLGLLSMPNALFYYASPENRWAETLLPHVQ